MADREALAGLIASAWVSSFIGRAHQGDQFSVDQGVRASAWAHWAVSSLEAFRGYRERSYAGILLPGSFHDPERTGPAVRPHLEIPARLLRQHDPWLPERLSMAGNGLLFSKWLTSEVVAVRRCVLPAMVNGTPASLLESLSGFRESLALAVADMTAAVLADFDPIEDCLVTDPADLLPEATGPFSPGEIADFFPPASSLGLRAAFDDKLLTSTGPWTSRRIGAWVLHGSHDGEDFSVGCVTPRLTRGSLARDPLFQPSREGLAALLVRGLLLRRLLRRLTGLQRPSLAPDPVEGGRGAYHLAAVVARVGAKIPEASPESCVRFLQARPDAAEAWALVQEWASGGYLLTVGEDDFKRAHGRARRLLLRAEAPEREDVNTLLPLAWDERGRVVRATFNQGRTRRR